MIIQLSIHVFVCMYAYVFAWLYKVRWIFTVTFPTPNDPFKLIQFARFLCYNLARWRRVFHCLQKLARWFVIEDEHVWWLYASMDLPLTK